MPFKTIRSLAVMPRSAVYGKPEGVDVPAIQELEFCF